MGETHGLRAISRDVTLCARRETRIFQKQTKRMDEVCVRATNVMLNEMCFVSFSMLIIETKSARYILCCRMLATTICCAAFNSIGTIAVVRRKVRVF